MILELKNVNKIYSNGFQALSNLSISFSEGEIFGLLGPNGAGKTTLSSIISGLSKINSGEVLYEGKSIYNNLCDYRNYIGLCNQAPNLDDEVSVEENLLQAGRFFRLPEETCLDRASHFMEIFNLSKYKSSSPTILSGGYKQRLMIARTLMHDPKIIFLDEPTVGLDPHIRREIWEIIKKLKTKNKTVILTTHYLDEAEALADKVCILNKGKLILSGTPEELIKSGTKTTLEEVFVELMKDL